MRFARSLRQGRSVALVLAVLVSLCLLVPSHLAKKGELEHRIVAIVLERTGEVICTGVLLDASNVLSANHCLEDFEADAIAVRVQSGGQLRVQKIQSHPTPSFLFPVGDLLRLTMERPVVVKGRLDPIHYVPLQNVQAGMELKVFGFGGSCGTDCLAARSVKVLRSFQGFWLDQLILAEATDEGMCYRDSGGPAFWYDQGEWKLAGLVSGKMDLLTGSDLSCTNKKIILTSLEAYREWISRPTPKSPIPELATDIESLCRNPQGSAAGTTYSTLLDLIEKDQSLSEQDKLDLLRSCKNVSAIFQRNQEKKP